MEFVHGSQWGQGGLSVCPAFRNALRVANFEAGEGVGQFLSHPDKDKAHTYRTAEPFRPASAGAEPIHIDN